MEDEDTCCCDFVVIVLLFKVVIVDVTGDGEMVVKHVVAEEEFVVVVIKLGADTWLLLLTITCAGALLLGTRIMGVTVLGVVWTFSTGCDGVLEVRICKVCGGRVWRVPVVARIYIKDTETRIFSVNFDFFVS